MCSWQARAFGFSEPSDGLLDRISSGRFGNQTVRATVTSYLRGLVPFIASVAIGMAASTIDIENAMADPGVWVKEGEGLPVNVACVQIYECNAPTDILHSASTKVIHTPDEAQVGVCSAGSGPIDSCNECLTNPPPTPCEYQVVPK